MTWRGLANPNNYVSGVSQVQRSVVIIKIFNIIIYCYSICNTNPSCV